HLIGRKEFLLSSYGTFCRFPRGTGMSVEISRRQTLGGFISAGLGFGATTIPFAIAKAQARGGTLTIGLTYDVDTLNVYSTGFLGDVQAAVVEGLLAPDSKAKYVPVLALEVPTLVNGGIKVADGKMRVVYKLRPGVTWHDGAPFTSADVKFTWE